MLLFLCFRRKSNVLTFVLFSQKTECFFTPCETKVGKQVPLFVLLRQYPSPPMTISSRRWRSFSHQILNWGWGRMVLTSAVIIKTRFTLKNCNHIILWETFQLFWLSGTQPNSSTFIHVLEQTLTPLTVTKANWYLRDYSMKSKSILRKLHWHFCRISDSSELKMSAQISNSGRNIPKWRQKLAAAWNECKRGNKATIYQH